MKLRGKTIRWIAMLAILISSLSASADSHVGSAQVASFEDCAHDHADASDPVEKVIADQQDAMFAILVHEGYLKPGLVAATDSAFITTTANLQIFVDEENQFAGVSYTLSKWSSDHARAQQRLFELKDLQRGFAFAKVKGKTAASLSSEKIGPDGGIVDLSYMTDYKAGKTAIYRLGVRKGAGGNWEFYDPTTGVAMHRMKLVTWASLAPLNGGIKQVVPEP